MGVPYVIPLESIEIQLFNGKETEYLSASSSQMIVEEVGLYFNMKFYTQHHMYLIDLHIGMSKRVGGGNATVIGYKMIEGIKTYMPEVKGSKSDKWLRSYGHSQFCMF